MLLFNCNLINPNPMMQNPRIIIGIDVNKEYTERIDVSETPKIIRIPPIIKSLVFISLTCPFDTSTILQMSAISHARR